MKFYVGFFSFGLKVCCNVRESRATEPSPRHSESPREEQHEEDNDQHPNKTRGCIAIRMIAKVGQPSHQQQNENDQQQ
jgi:hypothetical protein